jgi:hypothetical protein
MDNPGQGQHWAQDRTKINKSITQDLKRYETLTPPEMGEKGGG